MPKKKPIAKRLDKLFKDIKPEEAAGQAGGASHRRVLEEKASAVAKARSSTATSPVKAVKRTASEEVALSLAFRTGQNDWSTLQVVDERAPRTWNQDEQLLVQQVADQLSLALENARLFQETQARAEELTVLNEMGRELSTKLEVSGIAEIVYRYTSRLMDTSNFFFALYNEKTEEKSYPLVFEKGRRVRLPPRKIGNRGFSDYIIRNKKAIFAPADVAGHMKALGIELVPLHQDDKPPQSWLGVPMLIGERMLGLISAQNVERPHVYDEHDRDILATIASQAAIALENARLFEEIQRRADETARLNDLITSVSESLDVQKNLQRIASEIADFTSALHVGIALIVPEQNVLVLTADAPVPEGRSDLGTKIPIAGNPTAELVITERSPLFINDALNNPLTAHIVDILKMRGTESLFIWPIIAGRDVIGTLGLDFAEPHYKLPANQENLINTILFQTSTSIQNGRLFQEARRRAQETAALAEVGREISVTLDLESVLTRIASFAKDLFQAESCAVYLPEADGEDWRAIAALGLDAEEIKNDPIKTDRGILGGIIVSKAGRMVNNAGNVPEAVTVTGTVSQPFEHILGVPILSLDQVTGLLAVWRTGQGQEFSPAELEFLTSLARQAAIAIQNARLFKEITESREALAKSEADLRALFSSMQDVVLVVDRDTRYLRIAPTNPSRLFRPPQELLGKRMDVILPPDTHEPIRNAISQALTTGETVQLEYELPIGDERFWFLANISKLNESEVFWVARDITERKKSEEALRESDARLRLILETAIDAFISMDSEGQIIEWNPQATQIFGWRREEAVGRTLADLIIPNIHRDAHRRGLKHYLATGGGPVLNKRIEISGLHREGHLFPVELTITSIPTAGTLTFSAFIRDITQRKRSEEALQRRNTHLAVSSEIGRLVTSTLELNTIFTRTVNLVSERFGFYFASIYTMEETGFHAVLREATGAAGEKMKMHKYMVAVGSKNIVGKVAETGEAKIVDDVSEEPLYQPNPLLLDTQSEAVVPLRIGSRIVGVIDIQSKQTHAFTQDDISVLQSLADQVAVAIDNARSYELSQQAINELREVDQMKSQFLANMSHELRTPLNSIIGFSRVILKGIDGPVTDMQQQDLTAIYNSGQHLLGLINDVLDLARIEAGKMELNFEEVNLSEMVTSVMSTAKGLVKEKRIELQQRIPPEMPTVRGDTMRVRQVLLNLISNASKFTDEGSITVEAQVQSGSTGKMEARISVIDTGPGISREDQKKLFQAFSQVDGSATRKSGGSGLGLSICANLVQLHGGRIGVESDSGRGSTFYFTIPLFHQPMEDIPEGKKVILSIDDDPQVILLYERYLNPQGYHVVPLTDPTKAKERISELKPYAVILDIMMPHRDGWTILQDLKSDPGTRHYPVVICSILEQADKGFSLGATDYLIKPILQEDLVNAMDRVNKNGAIHDVLVIDDDPNDLRLIERILDEHGHYRPILAQGGRKGWEAINTKMPDAIILDIFMPEMDGFTILEKLRENPALRDIPVLVVSGGGLTNEQQQQLIDFGQSLLIKASLNERELIESIEHALKRIDS